MTRRKSIAAATAEHDGFNPEVAHAHDAIPPNRPTPSLGSRGLWKRRRRCPDRRHGRRRGRSTTGHRGWRWGQLVHRGLRGPKWHSRCGGGTTRRSCLRRTDRWYWGSIPRHRRERRRWRFFRYGRFRRKRWHHRHGRSISDWRHFKHRRRRRNGRHERHGRSTHGWRRCWYRRHDRN